MKRRKLLLIFVLIGLALAACQTSPEEGIRVAPEVGALAPDFSLTNTAGESVSLTGQRGKVVLVNFWATWCPPCRQEMPGILSRFQQHNGDLVVLAVDSEEPLSLVQDFRDEFELTFEPLLDSDGAVNQLYQVRGLPTSMFINEHGMIQFVHIGFMTEQQLDGYLAQMGLGEETALGSGLSAD